jgi:hypothetical protein
MLQSTVDAIRSYRSIYETAPGTSLSDDKHNDNSQDDEPSQRNINSTAITDKDSRLILASISAFARSSFKL